MQRALVWLNLYGRGAVRHKLKNSLKTQKMHFLPVFELMLDNLTTMQGQLQLPVAVLGLCKLSHTNGIPFSRYFDLISFIGNLYSISGGGCW